MHDGGRGLAIALEDCQSLARIGGRQRGGVPVQVKSHPIGFGSGDWTCVVGELENGSRMVTLAKWRDGAIAEEYIWL